ncbi:MAG: HAMP domain-containing protein [bacterium]|nr:HAMP domain-containing protein [bacterium]
MIKNLKVGKKLLVSFSILVAILIASAVIAILFTNSIGTHGVEVGEILAPLGEAAIDIKLSATQAHLVFEEIVGGGIDKDIKVVWELLDQTAKHAEGIINGDETPGAIIYPSTNPRVIKKIEEVKTLLAGFRKSAQARYDKFKADSSKTNTAATPTDAATTGDATTTGDAATPAASTPAASPGSDTDAKEFDESFAAFMKQAAEVRDLIHRDMDAKLEILKTDTGETKLAMIIICAIGIFIAVLFSFLISRSISMPLKECVSFADRVAGGDLTATIEMPQKDEIGQLTVSMDTMSHQTRETIVMVKTGVSELNRNTEHIVTGGAELAVRTNQQAASLTQTSTTIEEFTSILKRSSETSEEASSTLEDFNAEIQAKKELIANVTSTMTEISDSSKKIDNIVNVINDISFQTNLLALNAAVEAARAGEAGRGFAVVASEVRNLAQKTAESSKTIQEIVTQNVESTQRGMELTKQTSEFFETIVQTLQHMSDTIRQITAGAAEQSSGVEQINQSIIELEKVVNQNSSLVQTFEETAKALQSGTDELLGLMAHFKTEAGEVSTEEETPPPSKTRSKTKTRTKTSTKTRAKTRAKTETKKTTAKKKKDAKTETKSKETKAPPPPAKDEEDDFFSPDEDGFQEF